MNEVQRVWVLRWQSGSEPESRSDELAAEEPLELHIGGRPVSVTMRTPGHDLELAAGFFFTEGILETATPPLLRREGANVINMAAPEGSEWSHLARSGISMSSCGLCGKTTIEAVHRRIPAVESNMEICAPLLLTFPDRISANQATFRRTGGLHAAAVFDQEGNLLVLREDIGRHNAVDKVIGYGVLHRLLPLDSHVLLVSGRVSFEIMQKALAARIPVIAAVSAPSSLAVEFAEESGQTLIGFLREGRFNIYSHPQRVTDSGQSCSPKREAL
jgi:FdhD protein